MQNLKENIEKLNNYLSDTSYNDIDIVDLIKYLSSKFGVKQEIQKEKYQRLEEYIGDSKKVLLEEFGVIEKEHNFFDDLEDFKIKISNLFKNKLSNYKDDSLEDIYNKLDDFEGRLI